MNLLEIQKFVKKIAEKFPEEEDALDMLARLTEECGEVASEIRKIEKKGSKVYFNLTTSKEKVADELVDVLNVVASIANLYELNLDTESNRRNTHIKKILKIEN